MEARLKIVEKRSLRIEIATWASVGLTLLRLAFPAKPEPQQSQAPSENTERLRSLATETKATANSG